ncbi:MAG TPA: DUF1203 domain-containing protein [Woeseiaceae bacterium]|nr:DUF1203 domain-containing protein [Woeseiaceae bacterium]
MARFRISGIPNALAAEVRQTLRAPAYGHPASREPATGYGPCRHCLRSFAIGREDRILFTYQPFVEPGSLPAPGPVFIHAEDCEHYVGSTLPSDFRTLPLVFEAYRNGGWQAAQERIGTGASDERLEALFDRTGADYVHIRNAEAGCFMARAERLAPVPARR